MEERWDECSDYELVSRLKEECGDDAHPDHKEYCFDSMVPDYEAYVVELETNKEALEDVI